jgi:hypothetical protein
MVSRSIPTIDGPEATCQGAHVSLDDSLRQRVAELAVINALIAVELLVNAAAEDIRRVAPAPRVSAARSCSRRCR